jgi:SOS-response transcriptional repressor LexA
MALRDRLLTFLEAYWETHGYGPTLEEIRRHVGLSSRSHVLYHLRALAQEGRVQQEPGKHRTWRPTDRLRLPHLDPPERRGPRLPSGSGG